jgi:formate C-acetyltransferase
MKTRIWSAMDAFASAHPDCPAVGLKSRFHATVAEAFEPILFPHSPFFFEMGLRPAENWGTPQPDSITSWMKLRREHLCHDNDAFRHLVSFSDYNAAGVVRIWSVNDVFDADHHCPGYTRLLDEGVAGILKRLTAARRIRRSASETAFLDAAEQSCRALIRCAERFAEHAEAHLAAEPDRPAAATLRRIAEAARHVPLNAPRSFYEGLAALLFIREATATLEGIGVSVLGHVDRLLIGLYRRDLRAGVLTREQAGDLLARWMLHTDVKFHVDDNAWPETSTCIELGGCDADGRPLYNELTELIVETHHRHGLMNPKLNCRFSASSPQDYLDLIGRTALAGHNHFALLNDDVLIPACVRSGKSEAEARLYVNGGCQETIVEGVEHSAGAYFYFNLARTLDLTLRPLGRAAPKLPAPERAALPKPICAPESFDELYAAYMNNLANLLKTGAEWLRVGGERWTDVLPCPLFSGMLEGPVENARDYTAGGARYNPAGLALCGLGTVVDSLAALETAIFNERWLTFEDLLDVLAANWDGAEHLRLRFAKCPKFGHDNPAADRIAQRLADDVVHIARSLKNERGGWFQPSFFVYYAFVRMGRSTRATPDGRRDGDWLSQGVAPGRVCAAHAFTDVFHSLSQIDFRNFAGNAVLDAQMPLGNTCTTEAFSGLVRAFGRIGGPTLQTNCVSIDDLRDARTHPERHRDLVVRISGLSARFVALLPEVQDEIIARTAMG